MDGAGEKVWRRLLIIKYNGRERMEITTFPGEQSSESFKEKRRNDCRRPERLSGEKRRTRI